MYSLCELEAFVAQAISGDVLAQAGGGFVSVMAKSAPAIQKDIPAAFEMYTLLEHFLKSLPIRQAALGFDAETLDLEPGIWRTRCPAGRSRPCLVFLRWCSAWKPTKI